MHFFSLDTPDLRGDHENNDYLKQLEGDQLIYDEAGKFYGNCQRKAVHIREVENSIFWVLSENPMVFTNLTTGRKLDISVEKDLNEARKSIKYTKSVNPEYG